MSRNHGSPSLDQDPVPWESYDICQGAASQVGHFGMNAYRVWCQQTLSTLSGMLYHRKYDMRWAPPYLANCLQAAGYVFEC